MSFASNGGCVGVFGLSTALVCMYVLLHLYVCMYVNNGMNEARKLRDAKAAGKMFT